MTDFAELKDTIFMAIDEALSNIHTCTIAKIEKVNATTIDAKPVFNRVVDGKSIALPLFTKIPLFSLQGGSSHIVMPIAVGDYCLLIFTERCSDAWLAGNDNVTPLEYRMHDYSDGFALVGVNNQQGALTIPSVIQITGDSNHDGDRVHTGDTNQTGDIIQAGNKTQTGSHVIAGNLTVTGGATTITGGDITISSGNITITGGEVTADGIALKGHVHGGVQVGGGVTGAAQ
jgi:hypothetical protein